MSTTPRACEVCAVPLQRRPHENWADWSHRRFCGHACYARKRPLKACVTLWAYRMRARRHRKWLCERCGGWPVEIHHRDRRVANNAPGNLETLCKVCHAGEHPQGRKWPGADRRAYA